MSVSIYDLVHDAMRKVTSADAAYHYLRELGFEYTRAEVRRVWKEIGEKEYWSTVIETYGTERRVPHWWLMEGKEGQKEDYLYLFRTTLYNPETGELTTSYSAVLSRELTSFAALWEKYGEEIAESKAAKGFILIDWGPGGVLRKPH